MLEGLQTGLVHGLEGVVRGLAGELRNELPTWLAAIEQLEKLAASRYLSSRQAVLDLREDLKLAEEHATRLIQALESLSLCPPALPTETVKIRLDSEPTQADSPRPRQPPALPVTDRGSSRPPRPRPAARPPRPQADGDSPAPAAPPEKREAPPPKAGPHGSQLVVACPDCGSAGTIGWERLGHVLACKGWRAELSGRQRRAHDRGDADGGGPLGGDGKAPFAAGLGRFAQSPQRVRGRGPGRVPAGGVAVRVSHSAAPDPRPAARIGAGAPNCSAGPG